MHFLWNVVFLLPEAAILSSWFFASSFGFKEKNAFKKPSSITLSGTYLLLAYELLEEELDEEEDEDDEELLELFFPIFIF